MKSTILLMVAATAALRLGCADSRTHPVPETPLSKIMLSMIAASAIALSAPVYASDPCASVLCLYGKAIGSGGGSECKSAEKDFFNIIKKKKGSIRWSKTFDARKAFLNQCTTADPAAISKIMSKFGRSWG
ncbi:killer protein [Shigella sonnei]|nr:killer protein [Shigella sonnei]SRI12408.1 killer protein [Shigella sonnei]